MKFFLLQCSSVGAALLLLGSGCVVREHRAHHRPVVVREVVVAQPGLSPGTEVIVSAPPPPPPVEVYVVSPGPAYVWIPGGWVWSGRWVWEGGRWSAPPRRGAVWVPHQYVYRGGAHVHVHGGWR